ncbi:MAG: hypothetical protein FDW93_04115 [Bergeyella sp.]|nr:hypothetical protein [Bergeyella sp.]
MIKLFLPIFIFFCIQLLAQNGRVGINMSKPSHTLDVNGDVRVRALEKGISYNGEKILISDNQGVIKSTNRENIAPAPSEIGSVIYDGKKLIVAQEMVSLLDGDFTIKVVNVPKVINTINKKIVDSYNGLDRGVFKVREKGLYQILINAQLHADAQTTNPVVGLWNDSSQGWVARVSDSYTAPSTKNKNRFQTYTLLTVAELVPNNSYSFRIALEGKPALVEVKALSKGITGIGSVSYVSVKRIK